MARNEKIGAELLKNGFDAAVFYDKINLRYALGMTQIEGMVLITSTGDAVCLTDSRYIEAARAQIEGVEIALSQGSYFKETRALCERFNVSRLGFCEHALSYAQGEALKSAVTCRLEPLKDLMAGLREQKEPGEILCVEQAQRIAERALTELLNDIKPQKTERALCARLEYYMGLYGSEGPAFDTIFISGEKTSQPHGAPGERALKAGDFVTIDFGATVGGYRSDMTRTYAIGHADEKMRLIYDTVLKAQRAGIDAAGVGKLGRDVHHAAAAVIERAGFGEYFGHGLGHGIGLCVHESPRASETSADLFKENTLITIEPGIYLPGQMGVRIEDMLLLTKDGKRNLTDMPRELTVLKA